MARQIIGWSPVVGVIFGPADAPVQQGEDPSASYMRSLMAHYNQQFSDAEFHEAAPVTLLASAVRQEVIAFAPGAGRLGIVRGVAMGVQSIADFDNVRWAILVDGTAVPGFDNIRGPFGVFVYPKPVLIPLEPGQRASIVASNLTAIAIPNVTAYLMGTHFPMSGS